MPKYIVLLSILALLALLAAPTAVFAAEEANAVNPPGWLGGLLAALSLALAVGAGIWARRRP